MTRRWKLNGFEAHTAVVSALLSFELSRLYICCATRSVGSVVQLKIGPLHDVIDAEDIPAAKAFCNWEWAVFIDLGDWRLCSAEQEIASSSTSPRKIEIGLSCLNGRRISDLTLLPDGGLEVALDGGWVFRVSVENNARNEDEGLWTIFRRKDWALTFGQGLSLEVYDRNNRPS